MTSIVFFILVVKYFFVTVSTNEQCCPIGTIYKNETFISIRYSNINVTTDDMFKNCVGIKKLHMTKSNITEIRFGTFRYLTGLEELDLSDNNIEHLSAQFETLASLEQLTIHNNNLDKLGKDLFIHVHSLRYLNMSKNYMADLPKNIFKNNGELRYLILTSNYISYLPKNIFNHQNQLLELNLDRNRILEIEKELFSKLTKLRYLNLAFNSISALPEGMFDNNKALGQLFLQYNRITMLPQGLFKNLDELEIIALANNKISSIGENVFPENTKQVFLQRNQLKYLDASFIKLNKELSLQLYDNLWQCDCRLKAFFNVTKDFHEHVKCDKPKDLKLWTNLTIDDFQCPVQPNITCAHGKKFSYKINASYIFCEDDNDGIFVTNGLHYKMKFNNSRLELEYTDKVEIELEPQCLEGILIAVEAVLLVFIFIITYLLVRKLKQRANAISQNVTRKNTNIYTELEIPNTTVSSSPELDYEVENDLYGIELKANEPTH